MKKINSPKRSRLKLAETEQEVQLHNGKPVQAEAGNVHLLEGDWNEDFLNEYSNFGNKGHDDQVDAGTGAYNILTQDNVGQFEEDMNKDSYDDTSIVS